MIPVLYDEYESGYRHEGLGRLVDGAECVCVWERNQIYELQLRYPMAGRLSAELVPGRQILAVPFYGAEPEVFDIYYTDMDQKGSRIVRAWHQSYRLNGRIAAPYSAGSASAAMAGLRSASGEDALGFTFGYQGATNPTGDFSLKVPTACRSVLGGMDNSILDTFGGTLWWEGRTVTLMQDPGRDLGVWVSWGKNLVTLNHEISLEDKYDRVLCYYYAEDEGLWYGAANIPGVTGAPPTRHRTLALDVTGDMNEAEQTPSSAALASWAAQEATKRGRETYDPQVTTELSYADLRAAGEVSPGLEDIRPMDIVRVAHPGLSDIVKTHVTRTEWDVYMERYNAAVVGTLDTGVAGKIAGTR